MKNLIILLFGLFACSACQQKSQKPNIILFYSDEMDPEYLSAYGGSLPTPNIDKLAEAGIRFTNAYTTSPMCTPSRFSLLTGKYPGRCLHNEFLASYPGNKPYVIAWNTYLEGSLPTIASVLSENGYYTGMAGKWHIGKVPEDVQLPSFSEDEDLDDHLTEQKLKEYQRIVCDQVKSDAGFDFASSVLWTNFDNFPITRLRTHNFPWITHGAIKFLEQAKKMDKPFFLYAASTAVHGPGHAEAFMKDPSFTLEGRVNDIQKYRLQADSMMEVLNALPQALQHKYAGMACVDNHVKQVIRKLRELNLEEHTMIIFMADHNVEPGKATCYEKGLKVPLIIKLPDPSAGGKIYNKPVSNIDLFPTILQAADIGIPDGVLLDGINIWPGINSKNIHSRHYIFAESGLTRSVSDGKWKYIAFRYPEDQIMRMKKSEIDYAPNFLNLEKQSHSSIAMKHYPGYFDADQLYDLENDPYEQHNLAYDPAGNHELGRLQKVLSNQLSTFNNAYDLGDTSFMKSEKYRQLVLKSLSYGTDYIPWLRRDHGSIQWPPPQE
jgi:arylsulfatase A-like enzyme